MPNLTIFALIIASLALGCASIPHAQPGEGVVAFVVEAENSTDLDFMIRYRLEFSNVDIPPVFLNGRRGLAFRRMPVGEYENFMIHSVPNESWVNVGNPWGHNSKIQVQEGKITVFPWKFIFTQTEDRAGYYYQDLTLKSLTPRETTNIVQEIKDLDEDGLWEIWTTDEYFQGTPKK